MKQGSGEEELNRLIAEARARLPVLPGVMNLRAGKSITGPEKGYAAALAMDFADAGALEAYRVNPDHQHFVKQIAGPLVDEVWRYDFECS